MPELPEVETIARFFAPRVTGRTILGVRRLDRRVAGLAGGPGRGSGLTRSRGAALLTGRVIAGVVRRGKALFLELAPAGALVFRLGMTGRLGLGRAGEALSGPHLHAAFSLSGGDDLLYEDPRRFGRVLIDPARPDPDLGIAPDPLCPGFSWEALAERGGRSRRAVKEVLMDQGVVSGIGNIYAAEILHRAGVSPLRQAHRVCRDAWRAIADESRRVLEEAISSGGSTVRDFSRPEGGAGGYQAAHLVYGREGEGCRACGAPIKRVVLGGRSTFFCRRCQR